MRPRNTPGCIHGRFFPEFASDPRQYQWNADVYQIDESYLHAEVGGVIVGFCGFRLVDANSAEITGIRQMVMAIDYVSIPDQYPLPYAGSPDLYFDIMSCAE
jgi:hypothetical protein